MNWKIAINVLVALLLILGVFWNYLNTPKTGYVTTYEVYEGFDGKKELQKKLELETLYKKNVLDSMKLRIQTTQEAANSDKMLLQNLIIQYNSLEQQFQADYQKQNNEYTQSVAKQINEYTKLYAEEYGYDYIFGAAGNGSMMYGSSKHDITQDLIKFINKKYADK